MGVLNVTPDSFSDGGLYMDVDRAVARAREMANEGAAIVDVGGESTRPGAEPVPEAEELQRVVPVVERIAAGAGDGATVAAGPRISVDTRKLGVAEAALQAGARVVNDVSAFRASPDMAGLVASAGADCCLMHMRGDDPRTMQDDPRYGDVVAEVRDYLAVRAEAAMAAGVAREAIWLDPGIGFGKRLAHNLALLAHLDQIVALGFPVLLGVSRKSFLKAIDPSASDAADRLGGSLAAALAGADRGAAILRVHDVRETVQALKVRAAITGARLLGPPPTVQEINAPSPSKGEGQG